MPENKKFVYTYSAKQHNEIMQIREKYVPKKKTKLDEIRRLDEMVTKKASIIAIVIGIISSIVFGIGMCFTMVWKETLFIPGIIIGIVGIIGLSITFPLYTYILKKERSKIADQIIQLSNEVENENITSEL